MSDGLRATIHFSASIYTAGTEIGSKCVIKRVPSWPKPTCGVSHRAPPRLATLAAVRAAYAGKPEGLEKSVRPMLKPAHACRCEAVNEDGGIVSHLISSEGLPRFYTRLFLFFFFAYLVEIFLEPCSGVATAWQVSNQSQRRISRGGDITRAETQSNLPAWILSFVGSCGGSFLDYRSNVCIHRKAFAQ